MKTFSQLISEMWPGTPEYEKKFGKPDTGAGAKHDIKKTATGLQATRRYADDDETEAPKVAADGGAPVKRGRGRPPGKYGSYKMKNKVKEGTEMSDEDSIIEAKTCEHCGEEMTKDHECEAGMDESLDEAMKGEMHPDAGKVLKHIKPEHHGVYKPFLKKGVYKGDYKDRSAVLSAAEKAGHIKEEVENLDEISKEMLGSYIKKASHDVATKGAVVRQLSVDSRAAKQSGEHRLARDKDEKANKVFDKSWKRRENMAKAVDRLTKEDVDSLEEMDSGNSSENGAKPTMPTTANATRNFLGALNKSMDKARKAKQETDKKIAGLLKKESLEDVAEGSIDEAVNLSSLLDRYQDYTGGWMKVDAKHFRYNPKIEKALTGSTEIYIYDDMEGGEPPIVAHKGGKYIAASDGDGGFIKAFSDAESAVKYAAKHAGLNQIDEADFNKQQTVMAHTIGKELAKKGAGDMSKGGPYAIAAAMVRDRPAAAKKAYKTILAKNESEEQVDEMTLSAKAARAGKDIGKPGKNFAKIAADAAKRYGSEEAGKRVAGAILKKMRAKNESEEQVDTVDADVKDSAITESTSVNAYSSFLSRTQK